MINDDEKGFIFDAQNEVEHGLQGSDSGAVVRNISIDDVYEYNEAIKKFGTDVGRPMVRGVNFTGDDSPDQIAAAIKVIRKKLPDRFGKFFHPNERPRLLRGQRGTTFNITQRRGTRTVVDVTEEQPEPNVNGFVIVVSGDFEYGEGGAVFNAFENLNGFGDLEGKVRVGVKDSPTPNDVKRKTKKRFG